MILQPLVENSVKYAVAPSRSPVTVAVVAHARGDRLILTVSDDGPGAAEIAHGGFGIGLANIRDRLRARFGNDAGIEAGPTDTGYRSEIHLPLIIAEKPFA